MRMHRTARTSKDAARARRLGNNGSALLSASADFREVGTVECVACAGSAVPQLNGTWNSAHYYWWVALGGHGGCAHCTELEGRRFEGSRTGGRKEERWQKISRLVNAQRGAWALAVVRGTRKWGRREDEKVRR